MVVAFWSFPNDLTDRNGFFGDLDEHSDSCRTLLSCTAVFLVNGLLSGGGIGGYMSSSLGNPPELSSSKTLVRYTFDLSFFMIVTIGLLNLIFGIIIDTFSSLREAANNENAIMANKCTVCGLSRQEFERHTVGGWSHHYKREHNIWAYYSFLLHLDTKDPTEYTGLEDYVSACRKQRSLAWLPRHKALALKDRVGRDGRE
jgi:hypothetical protein